MTPDVKYRNLDLEQQLGFDWDEYNKLNVWQFSKWGIKNIDANNYVQEVLKREKLNTPYDSDLKQGVELNKLEKQHQRLIKEQKSQQATQYRNQLTCKKCGGHDFQLAGDNSKKYSFGKSVAGSVGLSVMTGGLGFIAGGAVGFAGKKGKKNTFVCMNCGKTREVRK
ncbi:putative phage-related hydrogenase [Leuconostoc phage phiLNTR2]|uniref:putative phage-related hydrogenase n=1 Tax=Leuconostoc phage phiLNTR2 TaxID=1262523 RepID=UPI0004997C5B|nr:putative phage-related hydrogenase [Leuconostoc phage phiLNTR2]AFY98483.1 putative phage-related hydrogenase [Leuconostoc phage phiLNTR2]